MGLHGHAKIELTDVYTGKTETVEHDNFITGGVSEYYRPLGSVFSAWELLNDTRIVDMFGSVLLFDSAIEGDGTTLFPKSGNKCLGGADYNVMNSVSEDWRGSCNISECKIDSLNNTATFVYDFATDQCNGTIGAVCCAPQYHAESAVFGTPGTKFENNTPRTNKCLNDQRLKWRIVTESFKAATRLLRPLRMDFDDDTLWLVDMTNPGQCTLEKHWAPCRHASLFHTAQKGYTQLKQTISITLPQTDMQLLYQGAELTETNRLYLFGYRKSATSGGSPLYFMEVDAATGKVEKTLTLNNLPSSYSTVSPANIVPTVEQGNIYLMYTKKVPICCIPLSDPSNISSIDASILPTNYFFPVLKVEGRIYLHVGGGGSNETYNIYLLNTADNTLQRTDSNIVYPNFSQCGQGTQTIPVKGYPLCRYQVMTPSYSENYDAYVYKLRLFLSTINNLDTPVEKTSDKTMKITYTIQEMAE